MAPDLNDYALFAEVVTHGGEPHHYEVARRALVSCLFFQASLAPNCQPIEHTPVV
jgi:hypothetical protein